MPPGPNASSNVERNVYRSFWNKYSNRADNTSMLLNANADELEELDRAEIIGLLPELDGKIVVDIGAGIGRFTTEFAQRGARKVVSADFMPNFINKNKERNANFGNIEWRVGDALGLEFEENSVDLLFTNWLLMYLSDEECVRFLSNVLRWLRPGGHLHLRESCSEPSTRKTSGGKSLHSQSDVNPTRYRFSSVYIELLRSIRHLPETTTTDGCGWRFKIDWACSVAIYIEKNANWRQIHWLVCKVPANNLLVAPQIQIGLEEFVNKFAGEWPEKQKRLDEELDEQMGTNKLLTEKLAFALDGLIGVGVDEQQPLVFVFNNPAGQQCLSTKQQCAIDIQTLANYFDCRVWSAEMDPYHYRHSLAIANRVRDRRVRLAWHPSMQSALEFWISIKKAAAGNNHSATQAKGGEGQCNGEDGIPAKKEKPKISVPPMFDVIVGVGLLDDIHCETDVERMANMLKEGGRLATLENVEERENAARIQLLQTHFTFERSICIIGDGVEQQDGIVPTGLALLVLIKNNEYKEVEEEWGGTEGGATAQQRILTVRGNYICNGTSHLPWSAFKTKNL